MNIMKNFVPVEKEYYLSEASLHLSGTIYIYDHQPMIEFWTPLLMHSSRGKNDIPSPSEWNNMMGKRQIYSTYGSEKT